MATLIGFEVFSIILVWQALVFAALFAGIYLKTRHYPKMCIAGYMISNAVYFFIAWLNFFGHVQIQKLVYPLSIPLLLSFFPLFYYYFRSLTTLKYRIAGKQWYHLLPSAIALLLEMPFFLFPSGDASEFLLRREVSDDYQWLSTYLIWLNRITIYVFFTIQFVFYFIKFRTNLKLHRIRIELMFSYKENLDLSWMKYLFIGILLFFIGNDLTWFIRLNHPWSSLIVFCIGMLIINFFIGYNSLVQHEAAEHEILSRMTHYCALHRAMTEPRNGNHEKAIARELQKYQRSALKEETREEILNKLQKLMEEEELYTDSEITLEELAMKLNANSRYLSQAINEVYQKNFFNYINDLRIAKAKKMLNGDQHDKLSIEGIAKVVGFQSKSSFYTAFKKTTGITPTEYKAHLNGQY